MIYTILLLGITFMILFIIFYKKYIKIKNENDKLKLSLIENLNVNSDNQNKFAFYDSEISRLNYKSIDALKKLENDYSNQLEDIRRRLTNSRNIFQPSSNQTSPITVLISSINEQLQEHTKLLNRISELENCIIEKDQLYTDLKNFNSPAILRITSLLADHEFTQFDISSKYLRDKKRPAKIEAERIDALKNIAQQHFTRFKIMLYKYEALLQVFPELELYVDEFESLNELSNIDSIEDLQNEFDNTQKYLSKEEFNNLPIEERNQLALDRYITGQKSKWQIGRDYELFCGQSYENNGWKVTYIGMEEKLNDLGRDLIAISETEHNVIQCKYWSKDKLIHEKHIVQIFGTAIEYSLHHPKKIKVVPVLMTNIKLSETAKIFAERLKVEIIDEFVLEEFPRIKCNLGKDEHGNITKIYHLPFDQQYDRTRIDKEGEFYAMTVKEAHKKGFRRAFRHFNQ